ncbi:hypothetical protein Tco_1508336 [Tanacetum coccineum]
MATLRYRDEHNKVGYLKKPTGSDDYHQILDFLRASHIRFPRHILATIDETPYTIIEESVRSQLQLADDGAAMLPQDQEGEGAGEAAQAVPPPIPEPIPKPMPKPDQPQDHLSTPLRQQTATHLKGAEGTLSTLTVDVLCSFLNLLQRTLKQMEDDRLSEEAAKRLHDEEQAQVDRQIAELNRRRQQEVLASAMYYTEADWINIMA